MIVITFAILSTSYAFMVFKTTGKINKHVYIANTQVTGLTKQQVYALLTKLIEKKQSTFVILKTNGFEKTIKLNGTVSECDMMVQINKAYAHGRGDKLLGNILYWSGLGKKTIKLNMEIKYNEVQIDSILESIKNDFINTKKSDIIKRINNSSEEEFDLLIDLEATKQNIKRFLCNETNKNEIEIVLNGK